MDRSIRIQLAMIGLALAAGVVIGALVDGDGGETVSFAEPPPPPVTVAAGSRNPAAAPAADIDALRRLLESEIETRRRLERRVLELGRKLDALERDAGEATLAGDPNAAAGEADDAAARADRESGWFDRQVLIDAGLNDSLATELQLFYEQLEMERLYLRDQSRRESWNREQYREALDEIEDREAALKERLGEAGYDAYLYASGQPNRVAVTSLLASAPAAQAGIEAGDHILRYDNQRVYNWFELREATTGGDIGDTVSVEVERDGQTLQFYLARGPLGIRMNSLSVAP